MTDTRICPRCGAKLSERRVEGLCPACLAKLSLQTAPKQSQVVGDYELLEEINRGGMGIVYKARQCSLERIVALKMILSGHFARSEEVQRFKAEALAAGNLQHPHIVAIHEVGQWEGHHFFSMDYVQGPSLAQLVREQPLPAERAARYLRTIAQAVQYAHEHGVLHRDLKPSNVLIDQQDQPRITDFGLAKVASADSDLTLSGKAIGSPNYMPPEQSVGQREAIGPHSDVYSLGAMLYHLLTGRPPFSAETVQATLAQVLQNEPVSPRALNPTIPRDLETICLKCLEKDPKRRYLSARELADELERFLSRRPILARPVSVAGRTWRWCHRNPLLAAWIFVALIVVLLGFGGILWQWQRAERHVRSESTERARAEHTLTQLELQRVEDLLRENEAGKALAQLAFSLRKNPSNLPMAERLLSVLTHRNFALPLIRPILQGSKVNDAEFSPDGRLVATASDDRTARIWSISTGEAVTAPLVHGDRVSFLNFSRDSRWLATASADQTARIWDVASGQAITAPLIHTSAVLFVQFSPDGRWLTTDCNDNVARLWALPDGEAGVTLPNDSTSVRFIPQTGMMATVAKGSAIKVWECATGREVHTLNMQDSIICLAVSRDGQRLAVGGIAAAKIWDLNDGSLITSIQHSARVEDLAFSPDGQMLATVSRDRRAFLWDALTGRLAFEFPQHLNWVRSVRFSNDGLRLLTVEMSNRVLIWDLLSGQLFCEPLQFAGRVQSAAFHPGDQQLITLAENAPVQIWDVRPGASFPLKLDHRDNALDVQFSSDGQTALTASRSGTASLWDVPTAHRTLRVVHGASVRKAQLSPDGRTIATTGTDAKTRLWDVPSGKSLATIPHGGQVLSLQFSHDGKWLVTASHDRTARTWIAQTGEPLAPEPMRHARLVHHAEFSLDNQLVVTAADDGTARIWDARTAKPLSEPLPHGRLGVYYATFSPDRQRVITTCIDMTASVWNIGDSGRASHSVPLFKLLHSAPVRCAQFSPDGSRILTAAEDNTVRLWQADTGLPLAEPLRHSGPVVYAEFSADGQRIVSASSDGTARVWDTLTGKAVSEPLVHHQPVVHARISPDARWILTAVRDGCVWERPVVHSAAPAWLMDLAEAVAGVRLAQNGVEELLNADRLFELRSKLSALGNPATEHAQIGAGDEYGRWARWFFADRTNRMLSPSASVGPQTMRWRLAQQDSLPGVRERLRLYPTNGAAWARLAQLLQRQQHFENPYKEVQAHLYSRRAVALSPDQTESWSARAEILAQTSDLQTAMLELERGSKYLPEGRMWQLQGDLFKKHRLLPEACRAYLKAIQASRAAKATPVSTIHLLRETVWSRDRGMPESEAQALWAAALNLPPRDPLLSAKAIDLSRYYNAALVDSFQNRHFPANNLSRLPNGRQKLAGVEFDVRGVIQLASKSIDTLEPGYPTEVRGIQLGGIQSTQLHFLHAAGFTYHTTNKQDYTGAGKHIGKYTIHYQDGSRSEIPLIAGRNIDEWWVGIWSPDLTDARVAWEGENENGDPVRLCVCSWTNPKPQIPIVNLDFSSQMTSAAPFLIAITVE